MSGNVSLYGIDNVNTLTNSKIKWLPVSVQADTLTPGGQPIGMLRTVPGTTPAGWRNQGTANDYQLAVEAWNYTIVTGSTGDILVTASPALVKLIRVGGTAALTTAAILKDGTTTYETLAAASAVGTERRYDGVIFLNGIKVNLATAGDIILVEWRLY